MKSAQLDNCVISRLLFIAEFQTQYSIINDCITRHFGVRTITVTKRREHILVPILEKLKHHLTR
jgi:hypothetical protein